VGHRRRAAEHACRRHQYARAHRQLADYGVCRSGVAAWQSSRYCRFTLLTWFASTLDLGWANTPIALLIATTKAVLVILFFMHVIHSTRLTWVVIIASFVWLGVLFVLTFSDYLTRYWAIY